MNWWSKFFNKNDSTPATLQGQNFTSVLHVVAEETIMAIAQWLVGVVKQSLDRKTVAAVQPPADSTATAIEAVIPQVTALIEQLYDRTQSLLTLEQRLTAMERSHSTEPILQQITQLNEQLLKDSQSIALLHQRLAQMETVLEAYRGVPRLIEQQSRAIATLQSRITELEVPKNHRSSLVNR